MGSMIPEDVFNAMKEALQEGLHEAMVATMANQTIASLVGQSLDLPGYEEAVVTGWDPKTQHLTISARLPPQQETITLHLAKALE